MHSAEALFSTPTVLERSYACVMIVQILPLQQTENSGSLVARRRQHSFQHRQAGGCCCLLPCSFIAV